MLSPEHDVDDTEQVRYCEQRDSEQRACEVVIVIDLPEQPAAGPVDEINCFV